MKRFLNRAGFTLVEVNLAIFIMAVGVLSMCSLYTLGYRENSQSIEDVNATAYADATLAPLVAALSSPLIKWEDWQKIGEAPSSEAENYGIDGRWPNSGWNSYISSNTEMDESLLRNVTSYRVVRNPKSIASDVFNKLSSRLKASGVNVVGGLRVPRGYQAGLVVTRRGAVVQIAFRLAHRSQSLMSQQVFVAEVHYQGGFKE